MCRCPHYLSVDDEITITIPSTSGVVTQCLKVVEVSDRDTFVVDNRLSEPLSNRMGFQRKGIKCTLLLNCY
jgi:hypothetical protein